MTPDSRGDIGVLAQRAKRGAHEEIEEYYGLDEVGDALMVRFMTAMRRANAKAIEA